MNFIYLFYSLLIRFDLVIVELVLFPLREHSHAFTRSCHPPRPPGVRVVWVVAALWFWKGDGLGSRCLAKQKLHLLVP